MATGGINGPEYVRARRDVRRQFNAQFQEMVRIYDAIENMVTSGPLKIPVAKMRGANRAVVDLVMILLTKALKTFRAIKVSCEEGCGQDASILLRALFENCVAVVWILQRASRKRTILFLAYADQRALVIVKERSETPGLKRGGKRLKSEAQRRVEQWGRLLTPAQLASTKQHWSGEGTLKNAAAKLRGWAVAYTTVYRATSSFAHGSDAFSHVVYSSSGVRR
jgi:hypothetical protein